MITKIFKSFSDKDFSELIKGGSISFILRFGGLFIGYLLTLLIANLFGAKGLGDYVIAITVLRLFTLFARLGLDVTSIRFISNFAIQNKWNSVLDFRKKIIHLLIFSSILSSLIMYFLANPISELINTSEEFIKLNAFFVLPMTFFMLHYESLRGLKKIAEFSFFYRVSQSLFSLIFILILYQFSTNSNVPIYAYLISIIIVSILSYVSFRYFLKDRSIDREIADNDFKSYFEILKISIPLMFAQSVQFIMVWADKLMLSNMTSPEDVGIYHTAFKISMFASIALMSINSIASPKFSEMFATNDMEGLKKVVLQSSKIIFWTSFPLSIIFFMCPEFLLGLFGEEFKVGVTAFIFLSIGRLFSSFAGSVGNILQMTGNQNIYARILFLGALLNVSLNLLLIPINSPLSHFNIVGINGAAFASMTSIIVWNLIMIFVVRKKFGFYTFYNPFYK